MSIETNCLCRSLAWRNYLQGYESLHSLGLSLILDIKNANSGRQALDYSKQNIGFQTSLTEIFSSVKGVIFLGTPYRGSVAASLAVYAARIA